MGDNKPTRKPNNFASQVLWFVWIAGIVAGSPHINSVETWLDVIFWPVTITYHEVGAYFDRAYPIPTPEPDNG